VPLPAPTFLIAHAVLGLADTVGIDPARDDRFIEAVRPEFPNVLNRQMPPQGLALLAPHLTLASTSSQLALSAAQADFEVRFFGEYPQDLDRCLEYVERKVAAVRTGLLAAGLHPSMIGIIATLHFSCEDLDGATPAEHVQRTLLRTDIEADALQDALARVAVKVRDTYFVTLTASNYESRVFERPIMLGLSAIKVRPWEGRVNDQGLELVIDINNTLEARTHRADPEVTEDGIRAVAQMLREVATTSGPAFIETGQLAIAAVTASSRP
jgi:hypothetical protein